MMYVLLGFLIVGTVSLSLSPTLNFDEILKGFDACTVELIQAVIKDKVHIWCINNFFKLFVLF